MSICSKPEVYFLDNDKDGVKAVWFFFFNQLQERYGKQCHC